MSLEDHEKMGGDKTSDGRDDSGPNESMDGLLDELLDDASSADSDLSAAATLKSDAPNASEPDGVAGTSSLEEGIVSSLLDELMASAPGSTEAELTEAPTAVPLSAISGQADKSESPGGQTEDGSADLTEVTDDLLLDDADDLLDESVPASNFIDSEPATISADQVGSEDPTAVFDGLIDNESTSPDVDLADDGDEPVGSEDLTSPLDDLLEDIDNDDEIPDVDPLESESDELESESGEIEESDAVPALDESTDATEIMTVDATEVMTSAPGEATIVDAPDDELPVTGPPDSDESPPSQKFPERDRSGGGGRRVGVALAVCAVGLFLLLGGAWAIDMLTHQGQVLRGTTFAGESIQGLSESQLEDLLAERTDELADQSLDVAVGDVTINTDPVTLGVSLDESAIIDDALGAGRQGFFLFRPVSWLGRFFSSEDVTERYAYDTSTSADAAESVLLAPLAEVKEPELSYGSGNVSVEPGAIGTVIDSSELVDQLPSVMEAGAPYNLNLSAVDANPSLTDAQVQEVADEINASTSEAVALRVLDDVAVVETEQLREWSVLENDGSGEASWSLDAELALNELQPLFPSLGSEDQQAKFVVVDEEPRIIPASETVVCCDEDSAERIREGLDDKPLGLSEEELEELENDDPTAGLRIVNLDPITVGSDQGVAELESLGIIEEVSTFTTKHACCQNRVTNIQRFADLTQGSIIRPGETMSLNGAVGQRTREKGFVADGAISLGVIEPQVGGGISQYATTFFNASFFAGLEFIKYQSHSLYISRYPRGREATISWRRPDLEVKNTTPYGILVWNSYTPTSITVTFYSTKHLEVEALPLLRSSERQCRVDITPRVITFPDGTEVEDRVQAVYRPGEGLDCNGNSTRPEEDPKPAPATDTAVTTTPPTTAPVADDGGIDDAITTTVPGDGDA